MDETEKENWNLKSGDEKELAALFQSIGEPSYRGKQAFLRIHAHRARTLDEFTEFPLKLRAKLVEMNAWPILEAGSSQKESEGTEKFVFSLPEDKSGQENKKVEAVWIVSDDRRTACISSQAGCTLNCAFCATGTMKFKGNLKAWQIVDQVYELIRRRPDEKLTNVVFMGMGEPFHNYDQVIKAADTLHDPRGLNLGARHITISTAGVIPGIERFISEKQPYNLAISLNHSDPEGRKEIMDVTERYPLKDLLNAARRYTQELDRRITFEYVMIPGVNMDQDSLRKLIGIGKSLSCKINLIPLNTNLHGWSRPSDEAMTRFQDALRDAGILSFNRGSPGRRVGGACGMLALTE